jgi:hypothetical protein
MLTLSPVEVDLVQKAVCGVIESAPEGRARSLHQYITQGPDHRLRAVVLDHHGRHHNPPPGFQYAPANQPT